jgi:hypothetical protein
MTYAIKKMLRSHVHQNSRGLAESHALMLFSSASCGFRPDRPVPPREDRPQTIETIRDRPPPAAPHSRREGRGHHRLRRRRGARSRAPHEGALRPD